MTTDAAVADTEVNPNVAEPITLTGDAEPSPLADAAEPSQQDAAPSPPVEPTAEELDSYVAEKLKGKEGEARPPEPQPQAGVDPQLVRDSILAYRQAHEERQRSLDGLEAELVEAGISAPLAKRFVKDSKDRLNEHHADSLALAGFEAAATEALRHSRAFEQAIPKTLNSAELKDYTAKVEGLMSSGKLKSLSYQQAMEIASSVRFESGRKKGYEDGLRDGFKDGRANAQRLAGSASSGQTVSGDSVSVSKEDELLLDPDTPIETVNKILARRNGQ